jgi:hypothetical protein
MCVTSIIILVAIICITIGFMMFFYYDGSSDDAIGAFVLGLTSFFFWAGWSGIGTHEIKTAPVPRYEIVETSHNIVAVTPDGRSATFESKADCAYLRTKAPLQIETKMNHWGETNFTTLLIK